MVRFGGGLDTTSPPLYMAPGSLIGSENYEPRLQGGYQRVGGYEAFDGRPRPSDATFALFRAVTTFANAAVGDTLTGLTSAATGVVAYVSSTLIALTKITGTFVTETLKKGGTTVGDAVAGVGDTALNENTYFEAAANRYRADIGAVPGSGVIRGIGVLNDTVYAFRDNASATEQNIYKSTAAGWVLVDLGYELAFTGGSGTQPSEGATITQGAVSATLRRVAVESGTFAGTNAAGRFIISGSFDTSFASVLLLLNGTSTVTTDSSTFARALTATLVTLSSAQTLFSLNTYLNAAGTSHLAGTVSDGWFGTAVTNSAWTVEGWMYPISIDGSGNGSLNFTRYNIKRKSDNSISAVVQINGTSYTVSGGTTATLNAWSHWALERDKSDPTWDYLKLYLNGVLVGTSTSITKAYVVDTADTTYRRYIGFGSSDETYGHQSQIRITNGVARYSGSTYTVPTAAFPTGPNFAAGALTAGATATITGPATPITLNPGGKWVLRPYNFDLPGTAVRLYGVDGKNKPIEFDGTTLVPINTGMTGIYASALEVHRNHLFVAYGSSVQHCGIGDPYSWSIISGAAELSAGEPVTELLSVAGSENEAAMLVLSANRAHTLYGTSSANWKLSPQSSSVGARAFSAQALGSTVLAFDDQGVRNYTPTAAYGNLLAGTLTDHLRDSVTNLTVNNSVVDRNGGRYRAFFSDGRWLSGAPGKRWAWTFCRYPFAVNAVGDGEISGVPRIFVGGSDGYVYETDVGRSFNGTAIQYWARTAYGHMGSPGTRKAFRRFDLELRGKSAGQLSIQPDFDGGDPNLDSGRSSLSNTPPPTWLWDGNGQWDTGAWDGQFASPVRLRSEGVGETCSMIFYNNSATELPHEATSAVVYFIPRRKVR
jgi:hypothetical protein